MTKRYSTSAGVLRWRIEVGYTNHVLVYYSGLNTADLFIHAADHTVLVLHEDVCTGLRNAAKFARTIGAHLSIEDYLFMGLTPRKPNVGKGRWAKR